MFDSSNFSNMTELIDDSQIQFTVISREDDSIYQGLRGESIQNFNDQKLKLEKQGEYSADIMFCWLPQSFKDRELMVELLFSEPKNVS